LASITRVTGALPLPVGQRLGSFLGKIAYHVDGKHRRVAQQNISVALSLSPQATRRLSQQVFANIGKVFLETVWSWSRPRAELVPYFRVEGESYIQNAHAKGRGVLVLTAHLGNWELLTVIADMIGHPINIIYRPLDFKPLERLVSENRCRFGSRVIPKHKALRLILRALQRGEIAAFLMDQSSDWYDGVVSHFFGRRTFTSKGLALLAYKTGAPVVPVFLERETNGFVGRFLPEIPLMHSGDKTRDIEENSERFNRVIEAAIRRNPAQWFWVHRRWKHRPYEPWPHQNAS
jgi:KDO2-lipid IV(A) lauroyltransferase